MTNQRLIVFGGIILGIAFIIVAVVYFFTPAASLPTFFPGYNATLTHYIHFKHGIAALLLGLAAFAGAWFGGAPRSMQPK